mgnify:CR=1 FL=1
MGSEMCIRDRHEALAGVVDEEGALTPDGLGDQRLLSDGTLPEICLLYTSDAADERSSVDLGGRRIIKTKKQASVDSHACL